MVFQLPTSSCPAEEEELVHSSVVARTTTGGSDTSERSAVGGGSEKRNDQCADPTDRKTKNNSTSGRRAAVVSLVAVEFLLDQQRSFLPSSRLQPFQVYAIRWPTCSLTPDNIKIAQAILCIGLFQTPC